MEYARDVRALLEIEGWENGVRVVIEIDGRATSTGLTNFLSAAGPNRSRVNGKRTMKARTRERDRYRGEIEPWTWISARI